MGDCMVNWYYVVGSERVGPVGQETIRELIASNEINNDTYVWRKGFQNWERLKDVAELAQNEEKVEEESLVLETVTPKKELRPAEIKKVPEKKSPDVSFNFDWKTVRENDEIFFLRIGKDRKSFSGEDYFGPYSLTEIREALAEKRINQQTFIFAPGMSSWVTIGETPLNSGHRSSPSVTLNEQPLMLVFDYSPLPLVTMVKKAGVKEGVLLGAGPFLDFTNKTVLASLYVGSEIKAKNLQVVVQDYDKKDQSIECLFVDLDQDAKRVMLNHAI